MDNMKFFAESGEFVISGNELMKLLTDIQKKNGSIRFTAEGTSMTPAIRHGDRITVSPVPGRQLRRGDIILFRKGDDRQIVVHRVISVKGEKLLPRGDNAEEDDGWISSDMIHGLVTGVERNGRRLRQLKTSGSALLNNLRFSLYNLYLNLRRRAAGLVRSMKHREG